MTVQPMWGKGNILKTEKKQYICESDGNCAFKESFHVTLSRYMTRVGGEGGWWEGAQSEGGSQR